MANTSNKKLTKKQEKFSISNSNAQPKSAFIKTECFDSTNKNFLTRKSDKFDNKKDLHNNYIQQIVSNKVESDSQVQLELKDSNATVDNVDEELFDPLDVCTAQIDEVNDEDNSLLESEIDKGNSSKKLQKTHSHSRKERVYSSQEQKHDEDKHIGKSKKEFSCSECGKLFGRRGHLNVHMRIHTGIKPYICEICKKQYNQKCELNSHMLIHSGIKPYICDFCKKSFSRKNDLNHHVLIHTGEKPHVCETCGKTFRQKTNLLQHKLIHSTEKPYLCDQCHQQFRHKNALIRHTRIHTGEKPYKCDICNKSFPHKSTLTDHMNIHTGEKPYTCQVCNKTFAQKSTLNQHKKIHKNQ